MSPVTFDELWWRGNLARLKARLSAGRPGELEIMPLDAALAALGRQSVHDEGRGEVPVARIVGTIARICDFDREFRPRNRTLRQRWETLAAICAPLPPVSLVRLGELYFVADGHHRVSVARANGRKTVIANVSSICTIAWAQGCLTPADLPSKAAERLFLERVPLPDDVRVGLWLDEPSHWSRLGDSAEAWGFRHHVGDRCTLAERWWAEEVLPVVARLRARGSCLPSRELEVYLRALAVCDQTGGEGMV